MAINLDCKSRVRSWSKCWSDALIEWFLLIFSYHHTVSAPVIYAFREALAQIVEEGLDLFKLRHQENAQRLREGLQNIGLELFVENPEQRLPSITSIRIPHGVKIENVLKCMMERYVTICLLIANWFWCDNWLSFPEWLLTNRHNVEISNGIGITLGILFRIGTMNTNASHQKVDLVLRALYEALKTTANFVAPLTLWALIYYVCLFDDVSKEKISSINYKTKVLTVLLDS